MTALSKSAIYYAEKHAWPVFPLQPKDKKPFSLDKLSINGEGGLKVATSDTASITKWWDKWPDANIGFACGNGTQIIVLDVDPGHGGADSLLALEQEYGTLPDTVESITGGGGRHLVFRIPKEMIIRQWRIYSLAPLCSSKWHKVRMGIILSAWQGRDCNDARLDDKYAHAETSSAR